MTTVTLREVGPRDGLQGERPVPVADRVALIELLLAAGLRRIEICAFVHPRVVPAMAGTDAVVRLLGARPGVVRAALVPNVRGAQLAVRSAIDELTVTISACDAYNTRNVGMTVEASLAEITSICAGVVTPVDVVVSCAFGSPYTGDIATSAVSELVEHIWAAGAHAVTLADTTGMATPRRVAAVIAAVGPAVGLHLHETRRTGLLNMYAALEAGVRRFDTSIGGLGGSPFADGAAGNVATEEAVALFDDLGISTGLDVDRLVVAALEVERLVGRTVPSGVARVGPRTRLVGAR